MHFGYIYGFGVIGCGLMYLILNLMCEDKISFDKTMSILGNQRIAKQKRTHTTIDLLLYVNALCLIQFHTIHNLNDFLPSSFFDPSAPMM